MIYEFSPLAFTVFIVFVLSVLGLSLYFGRQGEKRKGYYAAHGQIHWFVNGVAFAGDYLSAASFLGICGIIAFYGFDGFLYSIGFLAGWVVALFVIAEPLKRMGRFTFADALDSRFNSRGIKLAAAISTLVVSVLYLIPQMVGAGTLVKPLLGLPPTVLGFTSFAIGVSIVGVVVILIVVTAGMVSTTWVQFIKGSLLVIFCLGLTVMILRRGFRVEPVPARTQALTVSGGKTFVDGVPQGHGPGQQDLQPIGSISKLPTPGDTGPLGPMQYLATLQKSEVVLWPAKKTEKGTEYVPTLTQGGRSARAGEISAFCRDSQ